jgi:1,4-alpha-glucan branching enzyme
MVMAKKRKTVSIPPSSDRCGCRFEFRHHAAGQVCIAGSFNDWHPSVTPMVGLGDRYWVKDLSLAPGRYEYRFVVNGEWMDDPNAKEVTANPHGGVNAILSVY